MDKRLIKVRTIKTYKNLDGICKAGDILNLEINLYEEDVELHPILYGKMGFIRDFRTGKSYEQLFLYPSKLVIDSKNLPEGAYKVCDANIAKKGTFKSITIITEDGRRYPQSTIHGAIGYVPLKYIFEKV